MTGMWHEDLRARFKEQFEVVRAALADADPHRPELPGIAIAKEPLGSNRDLDVMYQDCGILVHSEYVEKCKRQLGTAEADDDSGNPFRLMTLPEPGARVAVDKFRERNGTGTAGFNGIISIADGTGNICPASEPLPAQASQALQVMDGLDCSRVRIWVIDTGLVPRVVEGFPQASVYGVAQLADADNVSGFPPLERGIDKDIDIYYGHGTFIAGILACVAPKAYIYVDNILRRGGAITETGIVRALRDILALDLDQMPDIISLSAGGYFSERTLHLLPKVVSDLQAHAAEYGKPILVAAAGNDGHNGEGPCHQPFYPAGLPDVISVGALRHDNKGRACFSNHGGWVRVYAPGERIVSWFPSGRYTYHHDGTSACRYLQRRRDPEWYHCCTCVTQPDKYQIKEFKGYAEWSGTSFSTPMVAGLIARQMVNGEQNAFQAAATVLDEQTTLVGGLGNMVGNKLVPRR